MKGLRAPLCDRDTVSFSQLLMSPCVSLLFSIGTSGLVVSLGRQSQEGLNPNAVSRTVAQIINHPNYNPSTSDNDISLLRLSSTVEFNNFIRPVCLAASDSTFFNGTDSWVTGWGTIGFGGGSEYNWI